MDIKEKGYFCFSLAFFIGYTINMDSQSRSVPGTAQKSSLSAPDSATFGAGCFWCVEVVFSQLGGVLAVESGYSGGNKENPTYKEVCAGTTNHVEVCRIVYDRNVISYKDLLEVFWKTHDPTTRNQQGNDTGTQYRSVIFYHNNEQKALAERYKKELNDSGIYVNPIVTEIEPFKQFYKAEDHHQNYYSLNPGQPYCMFVIQPKLEKFEKVFKNKIKNTGEK